MRYTTQDIAIRVTGHAGVSESVSVRAQCRNGLAIHLTPNTTIPTYTITHIASGLALLDYLDKRSAYRAVAAGLAYDVDWTTDEAHLDKAAAGQAVKAMRAAVSGYAAISQPA